MIDWYIIEKEYPNAFKEFTRTMFPNVGVPCLSILFEYDIKKLYRFFDKFGIFLTVEMCTKDNWMFMVSFGNGNVSAPLGESKIKREFIEVDGFIECFRLLENRLNK